MKDKKTTSNHNQLKRSVWNNREKIVDKLLTNQEWEAYEHNIEKDNIPSDDMYRNIRKALDQDVIQYFDRNARKNKIYSIIRYSVAACLILLLSWQWWKYQTPDPVPQFADVPLPQSMQNPWIEEYNTSEKSVWLTLPDASKVKLYPHSNLRYRKEFTADHRDIYLKGKAYFSVTKDPARPFSVYGKETKTTALGTSFTIDASRHSANIAITLHTGKVVVSPTVSTLAFNPIHLGQQGEKLVLDQHMQVSSHTAPKPKATEQHIKDTAPIVIGLRLEMDKIPMPEVIHALQAIYQAPIKIEDQSIVHITYTGRVDAQQETLEDVLNVICLINDLQWLKKEDGTYSISQKTNIANEQND